MKIAFTSELPNRGKVGRDHHNMRTEFAWMCKLNAEHYPIDAGASIQDYDLVIVILPKGLVFKNAVGVRMHEEKQNPISDFLTYEFIKMLKSNNKKVAYMQEGPCWLFNDYDIKEQIGFYNQLAATDMILAHNKSDVKFYKGLFPGKKVFDMRTLMITDNVDGQEGPKLDKTIIGGNFARWYGGFQSFTVASHFRNQIFTQTSHAMMPDEQRIEELEHLPRMNWTEWMRSLSTFKYAVHLMPTVAAGTFSLNCAYWGIPCIGNQKVDTQRLCFPDLSVENDDVEKAVDLAIKLRDEANFRNDVSEKAKELYKKEYSEDVWLENFMRNYEQ